MAQILESRNAELTLGYWGIRGLGQPIRFLLAYSGAPFTEVRIGNMQDGSLCDDRPGDWAGVRAGLDTAFPNLPYLIDTRGAAPICLTQSNAIMRYLARRFDLYGDSDEERTTIDLLQDEAYDLRNRIIDTAYSAKDSFPAALERFTERDIPRYVDRFEQFLDHREDGSCFVGSRISLIDFVLYELCWQVSLMVPGSITADRRPNLHRFIQSFEQLPAIKAYMAGEHYIERPINGYSASFH